MQHLQGNPCSNFQQQGETQASQGPGQALQELLDGGRAAAAAGAKEGRAKRRAAASDSSSDDSSGSDDESREPRRPAARKSRKRPKAKSPHPSIDRLLPRGMPVQEMVAVLVSATEREPLSPAQLLRAAAQGVEPARCPPPYGVTSSVDAASAHVERVLAQAWQVVDQHASADELATLGSSRGVGLEVKVGLMQEVLLSARPSGAAAGPRCATDGWAPRRQSGGGGGGSGQSRKFAMPEEPEVRHVSGRAAVNPVAASRLLSQEHMPRDVIDWAKAGAAGDAAAPKPVVQFNMADQASRAEYEREIGALLWKALEVDWAGRNGRMGRAIERVMGVGACERPAVKRHRAALMSFRFTKLSSLQTLSSDATTSGMLGIAVDGRVVTSALLLDMSADAMEAAWPEFDWRPLVCVSRQMQRMMASGKATVMLRAQQLGGEAFRELEEAADAARADDSGEPLRLLDSAPFEQALRGKVDSKLDEVDERASDFAEWMKGQPGAPTSAPAPAGAGGAVRGSPSALARLMGVAALDAAQASEILLAFRAKYVGMCIYETFGACTPSALRPCLSSHAGLPAKPEADACRDALKAKMGL